MDDASINLDDRILAQLRADFLSDARDRLDAMDSAAGSADDEVGALLAIRREAHNLKGMGGSFGFPSITLIAHRLEDFTAELAGLSDAHLRGVLAHVDCLRDIVEMGRDPGDERTSTLLRGLPAHTAGPAASGDFEVNEVRQVEVLLIAPGRAVRRMIIGELRALGFRVTAASSPWQALEMAARTRPDLVITSAVMEELSGIDLARALRSMRATENLPLALLTSLEAGHPDLARLPDDVAMVQLNQSVADELGDLVTRFDLT